jgi:hypothetical protein
LDGFCCAFMRRETVAESTVSKSVKEKKSYGDERKF